MRGGDVCGVVLSRGGMWRVVEGQIEKNSVFKLPWKHRLYVTSLLCVLKPKTDWGCQVHLKK